MPTKPKPPPPQPRRNLAGTTSALTVEVTGTPSLFKWHIAVRADAAAPAGRGTLVVWKTHPREAGGAKCEQNPSLVPVAHMPLL
jgi:hypothetical protein